MKKQFNYFVTACILLFSTSSFAQTIDTDTVILRNKKQIIVQDKDDEVNVQIFKKGSNNEYKKVFEGIYTDEKNYERWTVKETLGLGNIDLFSRKSKKRKKRIEPTFAGIGWGFSTITDGNKFNDINGVSLKQERSNEFFINPFETVLVSMGSNLGISSGLGFSWHNFFLENNTRFAEHDDNTVVEPAPKGISYKKSRLRTFQVNIPLLLEIQIRPKHSDTFYLSGGVVGGINLFSSQKVKYTDVRGKNIKEVDKGLNVSRLTMDFMAQIGYGDLGIYAKYSPFSLFQNGKGPNVQTASIGIKFGF